MFIMHSGMYLVKTRAQTNAFCIGAREKYVRCQFFAYVACSVQGNRFRCLLDGVDSASNRNEYQECFLGVKAAGE
jgi:hypothetical protein